MKFAFTGLVALAFLTGCSTDYRFTQFVGQQQNWTTSGGSFVRTVNNIPIYSKYPPRPYEIIGAVSVDNERQLARAVKKYGADAAMIAQPAPPGGATQVVPSPWGGYSVLRFGISAWLIRFK